MGQSTTQLLVCKLLYRSSVVANEISNDNQENVEEKHEMTAEEIQEAKEKKKKQFEMVDNALKEVLVKEM